jgi:uridylate kinase
MPMRQRVVVISIGGSIIAPKSGIDTEFLKDLRSFIRSGIRKGFRFILVAGGGQTARRYQEAVRKIAALADEDADWIGIHATRLNGCLLRFLFRDMAPHRIVKDPRKRVAWTRPVLIAAGWKPGRSTDDMAVRMAKRCGSRTVLNLTNTDAVYDKDPRASSDARRIDRMKWKDFRALVGHAWNPGANAPFDPVAARYAERNGLTVIVAGKNLRNAMNILEGRRFVGTVLE